MSRDAIQQLRARIAEFYLLRDAERRLTSLTDSQRANVRSFFEAAERRLSVARDLRGPDETPVGVTLYRQGGLLLALALLASKEPKDELEALPPASVVDKLAAALDERGLSDASELEPIRRALLTSDLLEIDRIPVDEAAVRVDELDRATSWMRSLVDARTARELWTARIVRASITVALVLACVLGLVSWAFAPPNVAKGKPVLSSSVMFSTTPGGIVDGVKSGTYGWHSGEEDAAWASIDLGQNYSLTKIAIYGRGDGHTELSIPSALEVSNDGVSYRSIATRSEPFSESDPWVVKPSGALGRFVRVHKLAHGYLVLSEVEVYGKKAN